MRNACLIAALLLAGCASPSPEQSAPDFAGRWDIEPTDSIGGRIMWLEIDRAPDGSLSGTGVSFAPGGQVDELRNVRVEAGELLFETKGTRRVNGQVQEMVNASHAGLADGALEGVTVRDGVEQRWRGVRAPEIADHDDGSWKPGEPQPLFDGDPADLDANWTLAKPDDWIVKDGILMNSDGAGLLTSKEKFWNFALHLEYRAKQGQNGGIGLRSRYEVQILGDHGEPVSEHSNGALYSRIAPAVNATLPPDQWQTYDIRLVGRDLTVDLNGQTALDRVPVDGPTAMATDWHEGDPGALTLQGDHGAIEFRKIVVTPLVEP